METSEKALNVNLLFNQLMTMASSVGNRLNVIDLSLVAIHQVNVDIKNLTELEKKVLFNIMGESLKSMEDLGIIRYFKLTDDETGYFIEPFVERKRTDLSHQVIKFFDKAEPDDIIA